ncbi:AraC family transcriptional regulator [Paenibacillus sp. N4]|uniref:AraC family transcriptional regulator n=1 Tax=Paenibacillus vietnamensis TaxID=2590547 RepID=UPI001CD18BC1|nr:AraC family transcriptional regulator [Paenibacillus vietnamensis]MCA0754190.1 AraC family transcriptional regulator [Paenibacillus vietnamensis]
MTTNVIHDIISPQSVHLLHQHHPQSGKLPFRVAACGHYYCLNGYRVQRQGLPYRLLVMSVAGKGQITFRGQTFILNEGQVFLLDCRERHVYECIGGTWELKWIRFEESAGVDYEGLINEGKFHPVALRNPGYVEERIDLVLELVKLSGTQASDAKLAEALCGILTTLCEDKHARDTVKLSGAASSAIADSILFMESHYREPLTVNEIAKQHHLTTYAFIRAFKRRTGLTPYDYLMKLRITKARLLLEQTDLPVHEISERIGFQNVNNFIRKFKLLTQSTPLKYRRQYAE